MIPGILIVKKSIFKSKRILISGMLFCFALVAVATMYETTEIDQHSGKIRVSYQVLAFVTVYSHENDTDFSRHAAKYVAQPPKWQIDTSYPAFGTRKVSAHYVYHGAIAKTEQIEFMCSNFDISLEDKEALYQFALKMLANYRKAGGYFLEIFINFEDSKDKHGIKWKEFIENMEDNH